MCTWFCVLQCSCHFVPGSSTEMPLNCQWAYIPVNPSQVENITMWNSDVIFLACWASQHSLAYFNCALSPQLNKIISHKPIWSHNVKYLLQFMKIVLKAKNWFVWGPRFNLSIQRGGRREKNGKRKEGREGKKERVERGKKKREGKFRPFYLLSESSDWLRNLHF